MGLAKLNLPAPVLKLPVPASIAAPAHQERSGPGSVIALPSGSIASDIRPIDVNWRTRQARYEVLVANDSVSPVVAFAYSVTAAPDGGQGSTTVSSFTVPAYTSVAEEILVQLPAHGEDPRVVVEILADSAHLTLDARPPRRRRLHGIRGAAVPLVLALVAAGALTYLPNRTSVLALAGPDHVNAGQAFDVAYAARSAQSVDYALRRADGAVVSQGTLRKTTGSFTLSLPPDARAASYDVLLRAHGPLGDDVRALHVIAMAPLPTHRRPTTAHVERIQLAQSSVVSGKPLLVRYRVTADRGVLQIIDQTGTVRASVPLQLRNGVGSSLVTAPVSADDQEFRVLVHAELGQSVAEQNVGVIIKGDPELAAMQGVVPPDIVVAQPVQGAAPGPNGQSTTTSEGVTVVDLSGGKTDSGVVPVLQPPFKIVRSPVGSGDLIRVEITNSEPHLQLALTAPSGDVVSQALPNPGQRMALFRAPIVDKPTTYQITGSYGEGISQETFVRPIVIQPNKSPTTSGR